jgi:hypothetical protein
MWQQWVNAILGIWVVALAFVGITGMALMWTLVVTGVVVAILGFWGAAMSSSETSTTRRQAYQ